MEYSQFEFGELASKQREKSGDENINCYQFIAGYIIYIQILTVFIDTGTNEGNKLYFDDVFEESVCSKLLQA